VSKISRRNSAKRQSEHFKRNGAKIDEIAMPYPVDLPWHIERVLLPSHLGKIRRTDIKECLLKILHLAESQGRMVSV
jgi:hypothetical protein